MQPSKKTAVKICPLIRRAASDIINSGVADKCELELDLRNEKSIVSADESLIERAVFNLINNSVTHNENGCKITITQYEERESVIVKIADNGKGAPREAIENIAEIPKAAHGLGLPMAYRIIRVHGGRLTAKNDGGLKIQIELPKL